MTFVDLEALRNSPVRGDPFDHLMVPEFIGGEALATIGENYPVTGKPGSLPLSSLDYGAVFGRFIEEIQGPEMTRIMSEKFDIDLAGRPTMVTVRAMCRSRDGQIHIDSKGKLVTVLLYLNAAWEAPGGRLRLLRGPGDIEDYAAEAPPDGGTLLAFRCTPDAWHGHKPFEGPRRAIQLNWVVGEKYLRREQLRHKISAFFKKLRAA
jgi:hypothetical protein